MDAAEMLKRKWHGDFPPLSTPWKWLKSPVEIGARMTPKKETGGDNGSAHAGNTGTD